MRNIVNTVTLSLIGALVAGPALASVPVQVPEPGIIGLFAAGAVAIVLLKNRNRK